MRIVTDFELFRTCASSGHNPRRFVAFNDEHLKKLENSMIEDVWPKSLVFRCLKENSTQHKKRCFWKLAKLLCNKGMVDPFDDLPMEVSSPRKWGGIECQTFTSALFFISFAPLWLSVIFVDTVSLFRRYSVIRYREDRHFNNTSCLFNISCFRVKKTLSRSKLWSWKIYNTYCYRRKNGDIRIFTFIYFTIVCIWLHTMEKRCVVFDIFSHTWFFVC